MIAGDRDVGVPVEVHVAHVKGVARARRRGGISTRPARLGPGDGADGPGEPVVVAHHHRGTGDAGEVGAILVRHVRGAVGRDADVAVQAATLGEIVDGHARTEGQSAIVAARADGGDDALRAVIDGVRVGSDRRPGRGEVAAADRLMVGPCRRAAALREQPGLAVVLGIGGRAARAVELRLEHAPRLAVRPEDGIERDARERRSLVGPGRSGRRDAVVEDRAQRMVAGLDEGGAGLPVDADGRFAGAVGAVAGGTERGRHLIVRRVVLVPGRAGRDAGRGRAAARGDGERCGGMRRGGHRNQGGSLAHVPDALDGIADHDVRRAWTGDEAVGRTGAVLGAVRSKGEHVHVGGLGAGPLIVKGQRGGVADVELGGGLRQGNRQIVVVADARRADLLDARVRELARHHWSEVPAGRRGRGHRAARGRGGASVAPGEHDQRQARAEGSSPECLHGAFQARGARSTWEIRNGPVAGKPRRGSNARPESKRDGRICSG